MRRSIVSISLLSIAAALMAACGGGGGAAPSAAHGGAATTSGQAIITIPNPVTASSVRRSQFVSASAVSAGLTINGSAPAYTDVSSTSAACVAGSVGRTCTIAFSAPPGNDTFVFTLYDGPNGTGNVLGSSTATQTVTNTPFTLALPISAGISSVTFAITPNQLQGPATATATLTAIAKDADGNTITGSAPYATPITVTNNDTTGAITMSSTTFTKPTDSITVTYSGAAATTSTTFTTTGIASVTPATLAIPPPHQSVYVTDGTGVVYVFAPGANGNVAPIRTITGTNTGLNAPSGVALDASGNIYIANGASNAVATSGGIGTITVYAPDANGNATPIRTISGSNTLMSNPYAPWGIAIDASGNLWAALVSLSLYTGGQAVEFAAGANGNATPIATITGSLAANGTADGIAVDSSGNIHEDPYGVSLLTFAPGPYGNVAPTENIHGSSAFPGGPGTYQIAFDSAGNAYITVETSSTHGAVWGWAPSQTGNVAPNYVLNGSNTGFNQHIRGIAFDATGNMYISQAAVTTPAAPASIFVFAAGASGNVAPIRTITGSNTGLLNLQYLTISP